MKRIAVCLSGQSRSFRRTSKKLKIFFRDYKVDYFLHTWTENSYGCADGRPWKVQENLQQDLEQAYNPRKLLIEDCSKVPLLNFDRINSRFESAAYSFSSALGLYLQEKQNYDLVIWIRYDILPVGQNCFEFPKDLKEYEVRIPGFGPACVPSDGGRILTGTTLWDMILLFHPKAVPIFHEYFSWMMQQNYGQWTWFSTNAAGQGREAFIEGAFLKFAIEKDLPVGIINPEYDLHVVRVNQESWTEQQIISSEENEDEIHRYVQRRIDSSIGKRNKNTNLI